MTKNLTNPEKDDIIVLDESSTKKVEETCDFCDVHCGNPWCVTKGDENE